MSTKKAPYKTPWYPAASPAFSDGVRPSAWPCQELAVGTDFLPEPINSGEIFRILGGIKTNSSKNKKAGTKPYKTQQYNDGVNIGKRQTEYHVYTQPYECQTARGRMSVWQTLSVCLKFFLLSGKHQSGISGNQTALK